MATRAAGTVLVLTLLGASLLGAQSLQAASSDRDHDGLRDRWEQRWGVTDPTKRDTDHDGIPDGSEDEDADRLSNLGEQRYGTDPTNPDGDGDGRKDGGEDSDGNGTRDALEQDRRPVPVGLSPPLTQAYWDLPSSYRNGCHSGMGTESIHPCVYGSRKGAVRIALFGDSHALQWLPALDRAGKRQGWRITALTKSACPSVDVDLEFEGVVLEPACRRWRGAARRWLRKHPQDVVIITNEGRYPLVNAKGKRIYRRKKEPFWQAGLARVLDGLPKRTRAVVLADTPHLRRNPVSCLREARVISDCVSRRASTLLPRHDKAERRTARAHGALFVDLNTVICPYDPCPIVSGDTLMWRDESHLTATFARQLAPAVRAVIKRALEHQTAPERHPSLTSRSFEVVVYDDHYDPMVLEATAGEELLITVTNKGREKHHIAFYPDEVGGDLPDAAIGPTVDPGTSATMVLTVPAAGEYHYIDEAVPDGPRGRLIVGEEPTSQ